MGTEFDIDHVALWRELQRKAEGIIDSDPSGAAAVADQAIESARKAFAAPHACLVEALERAGDLFMEIKHFDRADAYYREALSMANEMLPSDIVVLARLASNLGLLCEAMERDNEAITYYEQAIPMLARAHGPEHGQRLLLLNNLGMLLKHHARTGDAEKQYREALSIYELRPANETANFSVLLNNLGTLLSAEGRLDEAETLHLRALAIRERIFGQNHPDVGQSLANLAVVHHLRHDVHNAANYYQRAVDVYSKHPDISQDDYLVVIENYADLLRLQGENREADDLMERIEKEFGLVTA